MLTLTLFLLPLLLLPLPPVAVDDGKYEVTYTPRKGGKHLLKIVDETNASVHIQGSPFGVDIALMGVAASAPAGLSN